MISFKFPVLVLSLIVPYSCAQMLSGTTCATVLTKAIFTEGCKSVAAGMNAMDLRRGISMAVEAIVTNLKGMARMISTSEEIAQVTVELQQAKKLESFLFFFPKENSNVCITQGGYYISQWRKGNW